MHRTVRAFFLGATFGAALAANVARADELYPSRAIRIVVPASVGTGIDAIARVLGQRMGQEWNVPVVVDNRAGASGNIGTAFVASSAPDGYTLLLTATLFVSNYTIYKSVAYDPIRDFVAVAPLATSVLALVSYPSAQASTAEKFVALAKARPGTIYYASPGAGTPHHLAMEMVKSAAGIDIVHVPYKGSAQAVQDVIGGQVAAMFLPVNVAMPLVESGKLTMLAAGSAQRSEFTPDVPSLSEALGVRDIATDFWYGLFVPARTPPAVVAALNAKVGSLLANPELVDTLRKLYIHPTGGSPADLDRIVRQDLVRYEKLVRETGIKLD